MVYCSFRRGTRSHARRDAEIPASELCEQFTVFAMPLQAKKMGKVKNVIYRYSSSIRMWGIYKTSSVYLYTKIPPSA